MNNISIGIAQYTSIAGDIKVNIARHAQFMNQAAQHGIELLVFPELSLTGYEPGLAHNLAQYADCARLQDLRELAGKLKITTIVGLPLYQVDRDAILIASLVLTSEGSQHVYTKQHLHPGEEVFFKPGNGGPIIGVKSERIALCICADFNHAGHIESAVKEGAQLYAASVMVSEKGYENDSQLLKNYAEKHSVSVLMANHGGPTGSWQSAGRSAFWSPGGKLVASAPSKGDCLVIARREFGLWQGEALTCSITA